LFRGRAWVPGEFVVVPQLFDPHVCCHYLVPQILKQKFFVHTVDTGGKYNAAVFFSPVSLSQVVSYAANVNNAGGLFAAGVIDN
jgi:hypothetical protein